MLRQIMDQGGPDHLSRFRQDTRGAAVDRLGNLRLALGPINGRIGGGVDD